MVVIDQITTVLLVFVIFISGTILTLETQELDTSSWDFTGSDMASGLVSYFPHIYIAVSAGVMALVALERRKKK